ncbi:hypothetical protein [Mesorhizobium sp.]|uniref:hypothetical protein n=1 Tax=Mesorhizobium sp. TaxID=1871066 RepID=UPI000FE49DF5|nr:hypothetical protein [Mesorhizobium sp.]RWM84317.1 MAG: hypothetical protein EOR83_16990 [Mesorhizobium sp.]
MCFTDTPEVEKPAPPPEVLKQSAPDKKTAAETSKSNSLAIGTKKYRNETSIGTSGLGTKKAPTGITV